MPISQESLEQRLVECFPMAIERKVLDISGGCGQSYEVGEVSRGLRTSQSKNPKILALIVRDLCLPQSSPQVLIVSPEFAGKTTLAKHRLVNERLRDEISELHAFSQKTFTPEQYANVKDNQK
ncbi:hypothetical protein PtB15_1B989 [Puccinia triticina]|nr:hypothetical protein PtB15_1B989 [Puccinia triticina]